MCGHCEESHIDKAMMTTYELIQKPALRSIRPSFLEYQGPETPIMILGYEIGGINKAFMYADNHDLGPNGDKAWRGMAKTDIADSLTMLRLLCETLEIDFWDMLEMGQLKYEEKMQGLKDGFRPEKC